MTDKEIIKALECCGNRDDGCLHCPLCDVTVPECGMRLCRESLALINRQQAEIENYSHNIKQLTEENLHLHTTIKSLQMLLYSFLDTRNANVVRITDTKLEIIKKPIQAEAIKEFAERLKKMSFISGDIPGWRDVTTNEMDIDNLVKEMVGEQE